MTLTKYDYPMLERDYITSDISIRGLCEKHGITSFSSVARQAKILEWDRKRAAFKEKAFESEIDALAKRRAIRLQQSFDDAIDVIDAAFLKMADDMAKDKIVVTPRDVAVLIDKLQLLTGGVTSREEVHNLNLNGDLTPDVLRELAAAARANGAGAGPVGQSALPQLEGARKVN